MLTLVLIYNNTLNQGFSYTSITKTHQENVYYNQLFEYNDDGFIVTI